MIGNRFQKGTIKGIGKKSAERLIVELRDKLGKQQSETTIGGFANALPHYDAIVALVSLGIAKPMAEQAVKKAISANPEPVALEDLIKNALKNL